MSTLRHAKVLYLACMGFHHKDIGARLKLSTGTIKEYVSQFLLIFDVSKRIELAGRCPGLGSKWPDLERGPMRNAAIRRNDVTA